MNKSLVNGDKPHSKTLEHFASYPLVSDTISFYESNPIGQRSINVAHNVYHTFGEPLLPYLQGPYSLIAPYVDFADSLGNDTLSSVDSHFPFVKKTSYPQIRQAAGSAAAFPFHVVAGGLQLASDGKDYVFKTYGDEYNKTGGNEIVRTGSAVVQTELHIAADTFHKIAEILGPRGKEAEDKINGIANAALKKGDELLNGVKEQTEGARKDAAELGKDAKNQAAQGANVVKQKGEEAKSYGVDKSNKAKSTMEQKHHQHQQAVQG